MKILIVRLSSLGDIIHNMPMVADILRHHPHAQIDWVVEEAYADLVALNAGVCNVIPIGLRRWRKQIASPVSHNEIAGFRRRLRQEAYDVVLDTQGLIKSAVVMAMARLAPGGQRIGLANGTEGCGYESLSRLFHDYSVPVARRTHAVLRARLVAAWGLGHWPDSVADFGLKPPAIPAPAWLPGQPYAVFFHATARAAKRWNPNAWVKLAALIAERDMPVLLPWDSAAEREAAEAMAKRMRTACVLPKLSMLDAVLLAQRARLAVGVDTGLTHIAAAYCRPTIELYCDSARWNTEGNWSPNIINLGDAGNPPGSEDVQTAISTLLEKSSDSELQANELHECATEGYAATDRHVGRCRV